MSADDRTTLKISDGEKLIIFMLCDMQKQMGLKSEVNPDFVQKALSGGHHWALRWTYPGIFEETIDKQSTLKEVLDILDTWEFLEWSYDDLSEEEKATFERDAKPLGRDVRFPGFDGNNETEHLGIAQLLIEDMNRFSHFKGRDLNSHAPLLESHLRMAEEFNRIRPELDHRRLKASEVATLLKARIHPSQR